jgi:hypothetical protein
MAAFAHASLKGKAPTPLCNCPEKAEQTVRHLMRDCSLFSKERPAVFRKLPLPQIMQYHMIKQIMVNGGPWPPPKEELITKHLQAFLSFVKFIDFQKLN